MAQYQLTDKLTLRGGYLYNTNPIRHVTTLFNLQAPAIITNTLTLGLSYQLTENIDLSAAWMHGFRNSISGNIVQQRLANVGFDAQLDTLLFGVNIKFGRSKPASSSLPPLPTDEPVAVN